MGVLARPFRTSRDHFPLLMPGLAILLLAFLLPGHYPPWVAFEQQTTAAVGMLLVGGVSLARAVAGRQRVPVAAVVVLLTAMVPMLQWGLGQLDFLTDAILPTAYLLGLAVSIQVASNAGEDQARSLLDGLGVVFIIASAVSVALAGMQWLGMTWGIFLVEMGPGQRPFANLAQPNHLATLLALGVMATVRFHEQRRLPGAAAALVVTWMGLGMLLTQSRTAWVFVFLFVLWWAFMRRRVGLRLPAVGVASAVGLFAAGVVAWPRVSQAFGLAVYTMQERLHTGTRWAHWQTLWDATWRAPWAGYGWGQVGLAQQEAALDHPVVQEWVQNSHNLLLDLLIWNGVPLGLLLFVLLAAWVVRHIRACRTLDQWILLGSIGAVLAHSLLEYPLDYTYFLLPVGLMMGLLESIAPPQTARRTLPRIAVAAGIALCMGLTGWIAHEYLQIQESARQMRFALLRVGDRTPMQVPPPDVILLDGPREFHRFWAMQAAPNMTAEQLDWMRRVSRRYPVPPAMLRYATAAALNGRLEEATTVLGRLCKIHEQVRCDEGREAWGALQERYPVAKQVRYPKNELETNTP